MSRATAVIDGHLGKDAELRFTEGGMAVLKFRIAVTDRKKDANGEWQDGETSWFGVTAFSGLAEDLADLSKGDRVIVTGRLKIETYETREGVQRESTEVIADTIGIRPKSDKPQPRQQATRPKGGKQGYYHGRKVDEEVPF